MLIVMLSDRADFSPSEAALVQEALSQMNETCRISEPYRKVRSLAERIWGAYNGSQPKNRKNAQRRQDSFSHAMTIVIDTCIAAPNIDIPYLSDEERANAVKQVDEALTSLRKLKRKIVEGRWK